jgi:hypothetical protein
MGDDWQTPLAYCLLACIAWNRDARDDLRPDEGAREWLKTVSGHNDQQN